MADQRYAIQDAAPLQVVSSGLALHFRWMIGPMREWIDIRCGSDDDVVPLERLLKLLVQTGLLGQREGGVRCRTVDCVLEVRCEVGIQVTTVLLILIVVGGEKVQSTYAPVRFFHAAEIDGRFVAGPKAGLDGGNLLAERASDVVCRSRVLA